MQRREIIGHSPMSSRLPHAIHDDYGGCGLELHHTVDKGETTDARPNDEIITLQLLLRDGGSCHD